MYDITGVTYCWR